MEDHSIISRPDVRRIVINGAGWLWVLVMGALWSVEPWQRPWITRVPDERIWLGLACLGVLALIVLSWRTSPARMFFRAALTLVLGGLLLGGLRISCENLAVNELRSKLKEEVTLVDGVLVPDSLIPRNEIVPVAKKAVDFLEWVGVGSPQWLTDHVSALPRVTVSPAHQFLAQSRLPVRMKMADSMLRDPLHAEYLVLYWHDYFPAITGQDVTLECRSMWLKELNALRKESGLPATTQRAALLMMALTVLTDPPGFDAWRVPVRDAMLAMNEPWVWGQNRIIWYRSLDALLALDPPETWSGLTRPMTEDSETFLQAMEVPVRGLAGNFDAFLAVFENFEEDNHKLQFWQAAGFSLEAWPESFDPQTAGRIRSWRSETLFRWTMALGDGGADDMSDQDAVLLDEMIRHPGPLFTDAQQEKLTTAAMEWIGKIISKTGNPSTSDPQEIARIRCILHHLSEERGDAVRKALIPVMLLPEMFLTKYSRGDAVIFDESWAACLWTVQPHMSFAEQGLLRDRLAPWMVRMRPGGESRRIMLCIDAWSPHPVLPREVWLACAWSNSIPLLEVSPESPPDRRAAMPRNPYLIPEIPKSTIDAFIEDLISVSKTGSDLKKHFSERFPDLAWENDYALRYAYGAILSRMRAWNGSSPERLEAELKADLAEVGILWRNETIRDSVKERAWIGRSQQGYPLRDPAMSRTLWEKTLQDPQIAAAEARRSVGGDSENSPLSSLIQTMEAHSPDDTVVRAVWGALRAMSFETEHQMEVFGALFRIAHRMPAPERLEMRKDYLNEKVGYLLYENWNYDGWGSPPNPLRGPGGGIGIPWEEDQLSASRSWRAALDRQFHIAPVVAASPHHRELFAYLALGSHHDPHSPQKWYQETKIPPLAAPFPPTPWQKARDLHRKRPDLNFAEK